MRPIEDQVILVTGATDGIGRGTAERLATSGATVLLHGRSGEALSRARADIEIAAKNPKIETYRADFASLGAIRRMAAEIAEKHDRIDCLINNAGLGRGPVGDRDREESAEGNELRFQVNCLAPVLLTQLLVKQLSAAAPGRVVNVVSAGQSPINFDDPMQTTRYDPAFAYTQSKLALVMCTFELAARLDPKAVTVNALHPGSFLDTKMVRQGYDTGPQGPVETGIVSETFLATAPELQGVTGEFFFETKRGRANDMAYDAAARKRLWDLVAGLTGVGG